MNPDIVLAALDECSEPNEQLKSLGETKQDAETEVPYESGSIKLNAIAS